MPLHVFWGMMVANMVLQGILGLLVFVVIAWLVSENRRRVSLRTLGAGLVLQFLLGLAFLKISFFRGLLLSLNRVVLSLEESTQAGTSFVFGYLGGGTLPFEPSLPEATYILAFRALPLLLLLSALSSVLFYWGVLPTIVRGFSKILERTLRLGGAEGLAVSANIFLGMVEAPLFVRPYLRNMTRSELFTVMTCGMATIAGTVMVLYASILSGQIPGVMGHILVASIISAPAAVTIAKVMIPETGETSHGTIVMPEKLRGTMDALTKGTLRGVELLLNIIAMLIVLVALIHLVNSSLSLLPETKAGPLTLQQIMGFLMAPFVWLMGIPWAEAQLAGQLMGTKTILNELIAYMELSQLPAGSLSDKSSLILTYAMCGFANPGSLGIMIGGMGTLVPERRDEIVSLGLRSILAGTLATSMTGTIVGLLL